MLPFYQERILFLSDEQRLIAAQEDTELKFKTAIAQMLSLLATIGEI